jgi:hypothetical protein
MKFITANRKTKDQWNDNIVDTKKDGILGMQIDIMMEMIIYEIEEDSVFDSNTTPHF